jgi:hypothetical protein
MVRPSSPNVGPSNKICRVPLDEVVGEQRSLDPDLHRLAGVLSALPN